MIVSYRARLLVSGLAVAVLGSAASAAGDADVLPQPRFDAAFYVTAFAAADLDADGLLDLLIGSTQWTPQLALAVSPLSYKGFVRLQPAAQQSSCFAAGDFDGDGDTDVAVGGSEQVVLALGDGAGSFPSYTTTTVDQLGMSHLEALDLDADGDLDLLAGVQLPHGVQPLLGDGAGGFALQPLIPTVDVPRDVATGDIDLDGLPDFACTPALGGELKVALATGSGSFGPTTGYAANYAGELKLADLDADGALDLAWGGAPAGLRFSQGGGLFGPAQTLPVSKTWGQIAAADADGDLDFDLLLPGNGVVSVVVNDGHGAFLLDDAAGCELSGIVVAADLDDDGALDLAAADYEDEYLVKPYTQLVVTRGRLGGGFEASVFSPVTDGQLDSVLLADLDGDGKADLVLADDTLTHVCGGLGDGRFEAPVLSETVDGHGECKPDAAGDFDGDGSLDLLAAYDSGSLIGPKGVRVLHGLGDLTVVAAADTLVTKTIKGLEACDLDLDGDLDALAAKPMDLAVLLNDGTGSFAVTTLAVAGGIDQVTSGDVNADGVPDAVLMRSDPAGVIVLPGDGRGGLGAAQAIDVAGAAGVLVGDFDGDGRGDLAIDGSVEQLGHQLTVLKSVPGGFALIAEVDVLPASGGSSLLSVADHTGDGLADALLAVTNGLVLMAADGAGGLAPARAWHSDEAGFVAIGRVNADALPDVVSVGLPGDILLEPGARTRLAEPGATWLSLGHALVGSAGAPVLSGVGSLSPHSDLTLGVTHAAPQSAVWLVVGASAIATPFKGGTLVPSPQFVLGGLATDAEGALQLAGEWPVGVPDGTTLVLQAWIADAGGPAGFAASSGLLLSPH